MAFGASIRLEMKTFPLLLSLLAFIGFTASFGAQVPASPLTPSQRDAGIRELHKALAAVAVRLKNYREVCSAA
jgi:hypothetical protein